MVAMCGWLKIFYDLYIKINKSLSHLSVLLERALKFIIDSGTTSPAENPELLNIRHLLSLIEKVDHHWLKQEAPIIERIKGLVDKALTATQSDLIRRV